jgi:hypothetical protein
MLTNNALIAFECLHAPRNGNASYKKYETFKLNLSKAYDRVNWGYLKGILGQWGFHSKWLQWIMECVSTVNCSVHFNNMMLNPFKPSRGLRQGDPLSPYLFFFVADRLSKILQQEIRRGHYMS